MSMSDVEREALWDGFTQEERRIVEKASEKIQPTLLQMAEDLNRPVAAFQILPHPDSPHLE